MSISKEVRIGVLFTTALVVLVVGFYFLKGANVFANKNTYYAIYPDIDGLQNSATVQIKGLGVGHVTKMQLVPEGVKVEFSLSKKIEVKQGTIANLTSSDLLGGKVIELIPGKGPGIIPNKGTLPISAGGSAVDKVTAELTPRLRELRGTINVLDSALHGINGLVSQQNQQTIAAALQSIKITADNMQHLSATLNQQSGQIADIMRNANSFTANLARSNDTIGRILSNASKASRQLANAPLEKTITDLQHATDQLQAIANKVNKGEGSLGQLINNKEVYNNMNSSVVSLKALLDDMKANPKRYVHFSVFGGGGGRKKSATK